MNNTDLAGVALNSETMTSLDIAEITGKLHKSVLRDIRNLIESIGEVNGYSFVLCSYTDAKNQERPMYKLTKKDSLLLASGYNVSLRAKIINRWEELEKKEQQSAIPKTFAEALRLAAEQVELVEKQQEQLEAQKPKVLFADAVSTAKKSCLIGELAKILRQNDINIGQNRLFEWLRENNYICKRGEMYNLPTQKSMELGIMETKKSTIIRGDGVTIVTNTPKITGKGQIYFINKFLAE